MHRIAATPGGWNPQAEGVVFIEQSPAPMVFLTAADTDIQTLAVAIEQLPLDFPALRVASLLNLQQQLTIDTYADEVLEQAQVIVLRLLGGRSYWSYGLEVLQDLTQRTGAALILMPGDDRPDPDLLSLSTLPLAIVNQIWRYFTEGGSKNFAHALQFVATTCLGYSYNPPAPQPVPQVGLYQWQPETGKQPAIAQPHQTDYPLHPNPHCPKIGLLFYRAHYLAANTAPIDALCAALAQRGLEPVPVFVSSLRDLEVQQEVLNYLQPKDEPGVDLILNTTSFAIADLLQTHQPSRATQTLPPSLWQTLNVPVLQVILSGSSVEQWQAEWRGLSPRDIAMNVALPEVDGRIITRAVSFKAVQHRSDILETDVVRYEPVGDRIQFVADLAANWVNLRQTPAPERKIAIILANYPTRDGRLANGVGLDTPTSCIEIINALEQAGYNVGCPPQTSGDLIRQLTHTHTNDPEGREIRPIYQSLSQQEYWRYFTSLPTVVQQDITARWGIPDLQTAQLDPAATSITPHPPISPIPIPGIESGNLFIGIQPARGYDRDPSLNYHAPDLEPTHAYLAFYYWLRQCFGAQAIVLVGKHGNLEWLPGKSIALSENCYPEVALGALPHLYPFIVNDPGEGAQAKRRAQAVILDHLTPPMTRAELYGSLQKLEGLVDEYYEAQSLDPSRLPAIRDRITSLIQQEHLQTDLDYRGQQTITPDRILSIHSNTEPSTFPTLLTSIDGYLCELKEAQIRDGLHIFGQCPEGRQLRDLIVAIARHPTPGRIGLIQAIAQDWGIDFDPLTADFGSPIEPSQLPAKILQQQTPTPLHTVGDLVQLLETHAATLIESLLSPSPHPPIPQSPPLQQELTWITTHLLPALQQTSNEIIHLLQGLNGEYVPPGASGAPTRGRPEVLPTGCNFYSVDIRAIPTETAWDVGRKAAEAVIERYTQEHGDYPKTLGLSIWGTSCMRTGGDDLAEALALLGVQPVWEGVSRRVVDFEILPLSVLGRPRVDVTLRISGFFRDAFPNLIDLFDQAVSAVAGLDEPEEMNPLAAQVKQETSHWQTVGLTQEQARARSHYRIFGSKPGAYGTGLQGLIESQNWQDDSDLARAYINWSSYAYTCSDAGAIQGISAAEAFEQRLGQMQIVLHNQDNREHDLLDSDDYYQFQGGLTVAVRAVKGHNPTTYFGDHSLPQNPKIRRLQEEINRVYRSRVVNPKWLEGVMRHGYKGAFEMAATVDFLFAYDATAQCVADFMYQGVAEAYLFNPEVQAFIQQHNPWALRDMAERLLEAHQRSLWPTAQPDTLEQLRAIARQAEGEIETTTLSS